MNRILKSVLVALMLAAAPVWTALEMRPAQAQPPTPRWRRCRAFTIVLQASMKSGGSAKSRYEKLKPAVEKAFDLPAMTATAVGPDLGLAVRRRQESAD